MPTALANLGAIKTPAPIAEGQQHAEPVRYAAVGLGSGWASSSRECKRLLREAVLIKDGPPAEACTRVAEHRAILAEPPALPAPKALCVRAGLCLLVEGVGRPQVCALECLVVLDARGPARLRSASVQQCK